MEVREYNCATGHVETLAVFDVQSDAEIFIATHLIYERSSDHVIYVYVLEEGGS